MVLALLIRTLFIILSISLIAVAFIIFTRASHLKGQRFVFITLLCFGLAYFFETIRYMLPVDYSYSIQLVLVGSLLIAGLCLTTNYIHTIIQRHSLLKLRFVPQIFYLILFVYVGIIIPIDYVNSTPFVEINGLHVQEQIGYRGIIYLLISLLYIQIFYLLHVGKKYAPSEKRKHLYSNYTYGLLMSLVLVMVAAIMNINTVFPGETYLMISFVPFLIILSIENYSYSPGFSKHYSRMIEMSPTSILVLDRDFNIVEINQRAQELFKGNKHDPIHLALGSKENMVQMIKLLTTLQMEMELNDYRLTLEFDGTNEHFSVIASIFEVENQYYYYLLIRNVTKEHEQEETIFHLTYFDMLTNIYNRTYFTEQMEAVFEKKQGGTIILSDLGSRQKNADLQR